MISRPVLLDNTVLTNFALIQKPQLALTLWNERTATTPQVMAEYHQGVEQGLLSASVWEPLSQLGLTDEEIAWSNQLPPRLGAGERSCIAVAYHRQGLFVSDDADARRQARDCQVPVTGTLGILLLHVQRDGLTLAAADELLAELIRLGFRSPVQTLTAVLGPNKEA
jgi:predicted nucleic acid-binding protein